MVRLLLTSIIVYFVSQFIIVSNFVLFPKRKDCLKYNFISIFCFYSFFNIFINQQRITFLITITFFYFLSIVMYYVHEFRGTNANFSDLYSIRTAKEVSFGYKYEIKKVFILVAILLLVEYVIQIHYITINNDHISNYNNINITHYNYFWNKILYLFCFLISYFLLKDKISRNNFDYSLNAGENEGYIFNFVSSIPIFHNRKYGQIDNTTIASSFIDNVYSLAKENINEINNNNSCDYVEVYNRKYSTYAKKNDSPHVIVIMNESFGTVHNRILADNEVTPFLNNLKGVTKGSLFVNTFGGGTVNTEFEFLTGMTIGNYPYPVMPYRFIKRNKYSIARYFNNLGYKTIAMHPFIETNYNRNAVYKKLGFDELIFIKEFKHKDLIRKYISDESMYDEIIYRLNDFIRNKNKMFMFGITMQNHSGYGGEYQTDFSSHLSNFKNKTDVDNYLSLLSKSDYAINKLIKYLDNIDDHVVLLFFGDHNPSFGSELNKILYDNNTEYECTNAYMTPFFIYDNKNRIDRDIDEISTNFLSLELIKHANLPLDILHKMLNDIYKDYSVYNFHKAKFRIDNKLYNITDDMFMKLEMEYLK